MKTKIDIRFGLLTVLILNAAFSRILPHPYNFTPIGAMVLFGAAYFSNKYIALFIPLMAMWISDLVLNNTVYSSFYKGFVFFSDGFYWIYICFILIAGLGFLLLKKVKITNIFGASLSASLLFFIVSNFGVWLGSTVYPQNISGLIACYTAGMPFLGNTVMGDLFYSAILFGLFELAKNRLSVLKPGIK